LKRSLASGGRPADAEIRVCCLFTTADGHYDLPDFCSRILPPQSKEIENVVEARSVRQEALSADGNSGDQREGASVKKRTKGSFAAFRRRLLKIGRRLCCWCAAPTAD